MKVGMRTIKTAVAAVLAVMVSGFLGAESPFFMVIAAILTMQLTVADSFKSGKNRVLGTLMGAMIGLAGTLIAPGHPLLIGLGIILVITSCNLLKWNQAIPIASVVFLSIIINGHDSRLQIVQYSFNRILDTLLGIGIGLLVNYFIAPPKLLDSIRRDIQLLNDDIHASIQQAVLDQKGDYTSIEKTIQLLGERFEMLKSDVRIHRTDHVPLDAVDEILQTLGTIHDHMRILSTFQGKQTIDEENLKILQSEYNAVPDEELPIAGRDEQQVYNYHLARILHQLHALGTLYYNTFSKEIDPAS